MRNSRWLIFLVLSGFFWGCNGSELVPSDEPDIWFSDPHPIIDPGTTAVPDMASDPHTLGENPVSEDAAKDTNGSVDQPVEPGCEPGTGCPGDPCQDNADCLSLICSLHMGDWFCSQSCVDSCPEGYSCKTIRNPGNDASFVCVSNYPHLCQPCDATADCADNTSSEACVSYGDEGSFCGSSCADDDSCPEGFHCEDRESVDETPGRFCVPDDGLCPCSQNAINLGLSTNCTRSNDEGSCDGRRTCKFNGLSECDAQIPSIEICDGLDNDCNEKIDEVLGTTTCGKGVCTQEVPYCFDGVVQTCDPIAGIALEICDALDNDCDGLTDEDQGGTICGLGACVHSSEDCVDGVEQLCDPLEGASEDVCNGIDDDCDGATDEELGTISCGVGPCLQTGPACIGGVTQVCDPVSGNLPETCDGIDNDCDGDTDEDLGEISCGTGPCEHSQAYCENGQTTTCNPFLGAESESCDAIDNDCNGIIDDLGMVGCGNGACKNYVPICTAGELQDCHPLDVVAPESCDQIDNDCDGLTDEAFSVTLLTGETLTQTGASCGTGACTGGSVVCNAEGNGIVCTTEIIASSEVCDGVDSDCDGQVDEDLGSTTCGVGACIHTIENCVGGVPQICDSLEGSIAEVCDGIDNDCDDETDENLVAPLADNQAGVCAGAVKVCNGGSGWVEPSYGGLAGYETSESSCDGLDNDCDGDTDEGLGTTSCGTGACQTTVDNCVAGASQTCTPGSPGSETCDGIDNNCDGVTDEGTATVCTQCNGISGLSFLPAGTNCGGSNQCDGAGNCAASCSSAPDCEFVRDSCGGGSGTYTIFPNGSPITVHCEMGMSGGGWTQLTQAFLSTMGSGTYEYLYTREDKWYRSPTSGAIWNWDSYSLVTGTWTYGVGGSTSGTFGCPSGPEAGYFGVGCSNGGGNQFKCFVHNDGFKDVNTGIARICQDQPGIFTSCGVCCHAQIYVRKQ